MTTVLVTGATGFIGSHTAYALAQQGFVLRLLVRDPERARTWCEKRGIKVEEYIRGDISSAQDMQRAVAGCDALVHAAAMVGLEARNAAEIERVNIDGTRHVMEAALAAGVRTIIYVSSASALYRAGLPYMDESCEPGTSTSGYGFSKTECERYVRELQQRGAPVIITYPVGVIGPDDPRLSESVGAMVSFLKDMVPLTATGIQLVDVRDIAQAHCQLLRRGAIVGDVLQNRLMLKGEYLSWSHLAETLQSITGRKVRTVRLSPRLMLLMGRCADFLRRFVSISMPITAESMRYTCSWIEVRSQHHGVEYRDIRVTLSDTIRWLVREGHLPASLAGRLV